MALFAVAACSDPEAEKLEKIVGEWHYSGTESGVAIDVYIGFSQDYTFELYQKIGDGPHYLYKGKYEFDGKILSAAEVKALAEIPSKEVLLATVCSAFQAPIAAFARAVQAIVDKDGAPAEESAE